MLVFRNPDAPNHLAITADTPRLVNMCEHIPASSGSPAEMYRFLRFWSRVWAGMQSHFQAEGSFEGFQDLMGRDPWERGRITC